MALNEHASAPVKDACCTARRSSAVSQLLRKVSEDLKQEPLQWDFCSESDPGHQFQIVVATDRELRRRAYALAMRLYQAGGHHLGDSPYLLSPYDVEPQTLTLLARDANGNDAATISVVLDTAAGTPADEIFTPEIEPLRASGRRLAEVIRFAISPEHRNAKCLLVRLMNFVYIYARRVKACDDFIIEVHPRYADFYNRLLMFEPFGSERLCPRVNNAPTILLRLDFTRAERAVQRLAGKGAVTGVRSLYPYFYSWFEEGAVAQLLAQSHRPMSLEDMLHFGLKPLPQTAALVAAGNESVASLG